MPPAALQIEEPPAVPASELTANKAGLETTQPPRDAILSIEQAAELLGRSYQATYDITSARLLKYQLIDGERCVWLSDLLTYKRDFDRYYAAWKADPLNTPCDDSPCPIDVLPEYAHMRL